MSNIQWGCSKDGVMPGSRPSGSFSPAGNLHRPRSPVILARLYHGKALSLTHLLVHCNFKETNDFRLHGDPR